VISQHQRIRHRLEGERVGRAGNQPLVRGRAHRDDEMVVRHVVAPSFGRNGSHGLAFDVHVLDVRLDEARPPQGGADRLSALPQFQPARAGFEQERREHEEVLAAHERDLDVWLPA
jgi:hypothetical protein